MSNLPKLIASLIEAQNSYDSIKFSNCFAETAIVHDEAHKYIGRNEIKSWIGGANDTYKTMMRPIEYLTDTQELKAEISGNFPGSPLVLTYQFACKDEQIHSLRIV
ncbi:hypothetical protein SAMN04489724_0448 [Algoriphagus locisalis]|uniref:SnoaL-like domain-containing protein n=1 Tax=Algoriphagus locisalis TaxID=305507 RepID=A0A1I6XFA6_9BACT|nr:hypothetical protein [Algoriphagus locisalis]SFT36985.1 hypothetical protein SAMN04489724_0448 [Algoriphagus locisalis]